MVHWSPLQHVSLSMSWCPTTQPLRDPEALKPWFHHHTLDTSLLLNSVDISITRCQPSWLVLSSEWANWDSMRGSVPQTSGDNWEKIKKVPQVKASVDTLLPKGSQETLDPNQSSLGFYKGSIARTCSTLYPNLLFSKWDSRRHSQCCYIHLLQPICHTTVNREATPAQIAHPSHQCILLLYARIDVELAPLKLVKLSQIYRVGVKGKFCSWYSCQNKWDHYRNEQSYNLEKSR